MTVSQTEAAPAGDRTDPAADPRPVLVTGGANGIGEAASNQSGSRADRQHVANLLGGMATTLLRIAYSLDLDPRIDYREVDAVAEGVLRGDARVLAQVIWASVHGLVSIMITKPYFDWADRDVLIRTQLDVLFKGLTAQ